MTDIQQIVNQVTQMNLNDLDINSFWDKFKNEFPKYQKNFEDLCKYLRNEFGTGLHCNRFDIGNCFEYILTDNIRECGFNVNDYPNAKRIDIKINDKIPISIKYSSSGDIKLHNSNNCINTDMKMNDTILIIPNKIYLLTQENIENISLTLSDYLKNTGDGLCLKRSILTKLNQVNFKYVINIDIEVDKSKCKNRQCSKLFYKSILEEYFIKSNNKEFLKALIKIKEDELLKLKEKYNNLK